MINDFDRKLCCRDLKPAFLVNNFILGFKTYKYEDYLLEFINNSKFYVNHGNEKFKEIKIQNNGQADAENNDYKIDFKIFAEEENIHAKSELGTQITVLDGVTYYGNKESKYQEIGYFNLLRLFRRRNDKPLIEKHLEQRDNALKTAYKILDTNKNIFVFLPFELYYENIDSTNDVVEKMLNEMQHDIKDMMDYRRKKTSKDMYISFVTNGKFVIVDCNKEDPIIYDIVSIHNSDLFNELYEKSKVF